MKRLHGTPSTDITYTDSPEKNDTDADSTPRSQDEKVITFTSAGKPVTEMQHNSISAPHINVDAQTVFTVATVAPWYKKIYVMVSLIVFVVTAIGLTINYFMIGATLTSVVAPPVVIAQSTSEDIARQILLAENSNHEEQAALTESAISAPFDEAREEDTTDENANWKLTNSALSRQHDDDPPTSEEIVPAEALDEANSSVHKPDEDASTINIYAMGNDNEEMHIIRGKDPDRTGSLINAAYIAYVAGNYNDAAQVYLRVLQDMPGHRDALLGMAAIALRKGDTDEAGRNWLRVLAEYPDDPVATTGLINLMVAQDITGSTRAINALLLDYPHTAFLYFSLGNLHAAASRWPEARQAFAEASRLESENPDYVYNLAVSLEHLGDKRAALDKYKAVQKLARDRQVHFNNSVLAARINFLSEAEHDR